MAYRNGTYVAFDGLGEADPTKSDFKYYATIQAWNANKNIDFSLTNSHEKTDAVRDTSKRATLYSRIQERLRASKNMLVILTKNTRYTGSVLSFEIEQAIDTYKIPLIIAYPEYSIILNVDSHSDIWPKSLADRIDNDDIQAIHIAFAKDVILDAITRFHVNGESLQGERITITVKHINNGDYSNRGENYAVPKQNVCCF
jgi:Lhr-like helicase